jgi:hypothetical protein
MCAIFYNMISKSCLTPQTEQTDRLEVTDTEFTGHEGKVTTLINYNFRHISNEITWILSTTVHNIKNGVKLTYIRDRSMSQFTAW